MNSPIAFLAGAGLALAFAAFMLALWPAVADAPWEAEPFIIQEVTGPQELNSQATICSRLLDALAVVQDRNAENTLFTVWEDARCFEYFAGFAK